VTGTALIVGASGLVGSALAREFSPHCRVLGTFCHDAVPDFVHLDLRDQSEVGSLLRSVRPDVVLCPAAEPNVELCEMEPLATRQVNVAGLQNLIEATAEVGAFLVYFSSEYVFDGKCGPYSEDDVCNPLNEYGWQKMECERMITSQLDRHIIARISGVYDWEKQNKNFVIRLIKCLGSGLTLNVPFDQVITPTYAPQLARIVRELVEGDHQGCFHLSGSLPLPRTEFAGLIATVFDLNPCFIVPVPTSRLGLRAARPLSAGLRIDKAQALLDFHIDGPREGLEAMKKECPFQLA